MGVTVCRINNGNYVLTAKGGDRAVIVEFSPDEFSGFVSKLHAWGGAVTPSDPPADPAPPGTDQGEF